jgi:hypothetical protein
MQRFAKKETSRENRRTAGFTSHSASIAKPLISKDFRVLKASASNLQRRDSLLNREFFRWHMSCFTKVSQSRREDLKMNATTNEARISVLANSNEATEATVGTRLAQNSLLSELPGVVFGLITLGYIVGSLIALA